jgi:DNA-binding NtrC family response regulator
MEFALKKRHEVTLELKTLNLEQRMDKSIAVFSENGEQCRGLCTILEKQHYLPTPIKSLPDLKSRLQAISYLMVIMDLDNESLDNRHIRELTIKNPQVYFFGLTERRFNPELKEAISNHLYACLTKPVDLDELIFWIECIYGDETDSKRTAIETNFTKQVHE